MDRHEQTFKQEARRRLACYHTRRQSIQNLEAEIRRLEAAAERLGSVQYDAVRVKGGGDREEAMLRNIALRDELKQRLSDTRQWVAVMDGALGMLEEEERTAVEVMYISQERGAAERLCEALGVERSTAYIRAGRALDRFSKVLFGM